MDPNDVDTMDFPLPSDAVPTMNPYEQRRIQEEQILTHLESLGYKRWICVYPIYINKERSLIQGRKVPVSLGVKDPHIIPMAESLRHMGLKMAIEQGKVHPKDVLNRGRLKIELFNQEGLPVHPTITTRKLLLEEICNHYIEGLESFEKQKAQALEEAKQQGGIESRTPAIASADHKEKGKKKGKKGKK